MKFTNLLLFKFLSLITVFLMINGCSVDEDDILSNGNQDRITAHAGEDITVSPGTLVTLDGSASTGENYSIEWVQNSTYEATLDDASILKPSFIAERNGTYYFTLRLTKGNEFSEASVSVTVSGQQVITNADLLSDFTFDGQSVYEGYLISSTITIPAGVTVTINTGATLSFAESAGLIIDGTLNIASDANSYFTSTGETEMWRGVYISSDGVFSGGESSYLTLNNAGNGSLTDDAEDLAALTLDGYISGYVNIENSPNYSAIIKPSASLGEARISAGSDNAKAFRIPIHKLNSFSLGSVLSSAGPPSYLHSVDGYSLQSAATISPSTPVYVEDNIVSSGGELAIYNTEMIFDANTSIESYGGFAASGVTFKGSTETAGHWQGIYLANGGTFSSSTVQHAGSAAFTTASDKTAVYVPYGQSVSLNGSTLSNNEGIGLLVTGTLSSHSNNTYTDNSVAHISVTQAQIRQITTTSNTYSSGGVIIEDINAQGMPSTTITLPNLGTEVYYQLNAHLTQRGSFTVEAGVHIKIAAGKFIDTNGYGFNVSGVSGSPVTIEGTTAVAGHWGGIRLKSHLSGSYSSTIDYLVIKHGGKSGSGITWGLPQDANLYIEVPVAQTLSVTNSTISESAGYGVVVKSGADDHDVNEAASNNTLSGTDGDIISL